MQFNLNNALTFCLIKDRHRFKRRYHQAKKLPEEQQVAAMEALLLDIDRSQQAVKNRQNALPEITYPDLPVSAKAEQIKAAISEHQVVIVAGETGSGKTTQLPKMCLQLGFGITGYIGHTQPRRLAARSVADRIAEELNTELGKSVGYKVRFNDNVSDNSHIKLMTDGILLAEMQQDPYLNQYDVIIIDEAHERSLNIDFLLGYLRQLLPKRPDLKLIITSATIDSERFSAHFFNAPVIEVSGRTYPVEIRYRDPAEKNSNNANDNDAVDAIVDAVDELRREKPGDILVFLSGEREIRDTQEALQKQHYPNIEILPLFARLSASEQQRIFHRSQRMRIILATNVAETSLTVPGIKYVIDPGTVRISRYSARSKVQRLPIEAISQASANQRAGRCGRVSDGICIRLYSEQDYLSRPEFTDPEIVRTHLASVILQMLSLRLGAPESFPFIQAPEQKNINDGFKLLEEIKAINNGQLTPLGRQLARLPVDPKYAAMLVAAADNSALQEVSIITAGLSIQDPRERPQEKRQQADQLHNEFADKDSDFISLLNLWRLFNSQAETLSSNQLRKWCKQRFIHFMRMREWQDIVYQISRAAKDLKLTLNTNEADYQAIHISLAVGLLANIGFKDKEREYAGTRNSKFLIFPGSGLHKKQPKWVMAAELVETSNLYARTVAKVEPQWLEEIAEHLVSKSYSEPHWSKKRGAACAYLKVALYGLPIVAKRLVTVSKVEPQIARTLFIREALVNGMTNLNYAFLRANQALIDDIELLEKKSRRRDLLVDEDRLCEFYDQLIPSHICTEVGFKKWWQKTGQQQADLLDFRMTDLVKNDPSKVTQVDFPDHWKQGNLTLPLSYKFEPQEPDDGVSLMIPLGLLNQVQNVGFDWLVPGFQEELVVALIKSLPKSLRRNFVPAPNYAQACLSEISPVDKQGAPQLLAQAVADKLFRMTGVKLSVDAFNEENLPKHLRMNFVVVDEKGKQLGRAKNLIALQQSMRGEVQATLETVATPELERQGLTKWDFDHLPNEFTKKQAGYEIKAYPALRKQKQGESVDIVLLDDPILARVQHKIGVYQLIKNAVPSPLKYLQQKLPNKAKLSLYFNPFGQIALLIDDIIMAGIDAIVSEFEQRQGESIRNKSSFQDATELVRANINDRAMSIAMQVEQGLTTANAIQKSCKGKIPLPLINHVAHIKSHLDSLVYKGFVFDLGESQLSNWIRYLKALRVRADKLKVDPNRDRLNQLEVDKALNALQEVEAKLQRAGQDLHALQSVRWMIEEFRVSLFAQQLGTQYPISLKRIKNKLSEY